VPQIETGNDGVAATGRQQRRQHAQRRRLASPIRTEEPKDLASLDIQINPRDCLDHPASAGKAPAQVTCLQDRIHGLLLSIP